MLGRSVLEQEPDCAGLEGGVHVIVEVEGGEDHDARLPAGRLLRIGRSASRRCASSRRARASGCPSGPRPGGDGGPAGRCLAVPGLAPRPSMSGWASRIRRNPARTSAWSSAISTRTWLTLPPSGASRHHDRQPGADGVAAAQPRAGLQTTVDERGALPHARQTSAAARPRRAPAPPVVEDLDPQLVVPPTSGAPERSSPGGHTAARW